MNTQICVKYEGRNSECTVKPIYQYDVGRQLCVSNIDQNAVIQIHYSISGMAKALTDIPTYNVDNKVWMSNVPNALTMQQNEIQAYVYVTGQNNASATVMCVSIPVKPRAKPDGFQYTEAELKGLDFVLSQLEDATKEVDDLKSEIQAAIDDAESATTNATNISKNTPYIDSNTGCWMIWDVLTNKYVNTEVPARGEDGKPGKDGQSGVYIGDTEPTDTNINVWINPNGSADIDIDQLAKNVSSLKDHKADVIIDTSARAASHSLHAQDGDMKVTLYGKTTERGTGDKSPDNPYVISGVDAAQVHAGGKNLLNAPDSIDISTFSGGNKGFPIRLSADAVLSWNITRESTATPGMWWVTKKDGSSIVIAYYGETTANVPADTVRLVLGNYHSLDGIVSNIQLEYGRTPTAYEPYTANTITPALLPDGAPLMGNGTVDDTIENDVLADGERKCRVTRRWGMVTLDGSENWKLASTGWFYLDGLFTDANATSAVHLLTPGLFSDYLPVGNPTEGSKSCFNLWMTGEGLRRLGVKMISATTLDEFIGHLSENPLKVGYILVTPETYMTDPLPLRKPDTLESDTVTVTGSGETEVRYPCDTKDYIDRKFDALAAALLS